MKFLKVIALIFLFLFLALLLLGTFSKPKEIKTEIIINESPENVWKVFSQFDTYPSWNPFITSIYGNIAVGKEITVSIQPPGDNAMKFTPTVIALEPDKEFRWLGVFIMKGVFDGEHFFQLIDNRNGTTTFIHGEKFKGALVPFFNFNSTQQGFAAMNVALKDRVENK